MNDNIAKIIRPTYLANIISVANADGKVKPAELDTLRAIVKRIGATQQDFDAAKKLVTTGSYRFKTLGNQQDRISNLKDMVLLAISDGDKSPHEIAAIREASEAMGYSRADINVITARAESDLRRLQRIPKIQPPPTNTSSSNNRNLRIKSRTPSRQTAATAALSSSRNKVAPPPIPVKAPPPPPAPVVVAADPPPTTPPPPREPAKSVVPMAEAADTAKEVASEVHEVVHKEIKPKTASDRVNSCAACRAASDDADTYCFGPPEGSISPLGCRLSHLFWNHGAEWFEKGRFRDDATFIFDKEAIIELIRGNISEAMECPYFNHEFTKAAIDALPKLAFIGVRWSYREATPSDKNTQSVKRKKNLHGCTVSSAITVNGVNPIGNGEAMKIIHKALIRTGSDRFLIKKLRLLHKDS